MTTTAQPQDYIKDTIKNALLMSDLEYENLIYSEFTMWASVMSNKFNISLKNMINSNLWNYYLLQWEIMVEKLFYNDFKDYLDANFWETNIGNPWNAPKHFEDLMTDYINNLVNYYPGTLIKELTLKK